MPIDYETLIHEPARRIDSEKPMAIEVTQEDWDAAADFSDWHEGFKSIHEVRQLAKAFSRHRIAAYEKGQRDAVERLTGLGGGL